MNRFDFLKYFLFSSFTFSGITGCTPGNGKVPAAVAEASPVIVSASSKETLLQYWDNFNFRDTLALKNPEIGEQAVVNFIAALRRFPDTVSTRAVKHMLSKAKPFATSFSYFTKQYEHYLYDPNSPMRNDTYYQPVLEFLLDSCALDKTDKYRYSSLLKMVKMNSAGNAAPDFDFQVPAGTRGSLYGINAPFTLLFFYEPGCPHCEAAIDELQTTPGFQELVANGKLNVLAIYAMGDRKIWKAYQSRIPLGWTNGLDKDKQVLTKGLYEIRASPTIYLLDKDKVVLLKDTDLRQVASFLNASA
jgi:thiol-disulfide isomerase/thioredoxin